MNRWLVSLIVVLLFGVCAPHAQAQDLDDVPPPEELGAATTQTPLRIDWPQSGDSVKVPFTVTGVAAPGARLEIWIGDQLERVFLADANGRFNTAIPKGSGGDISVHQVDKRGDRVQSTSVSVIWAGAAPQLDPQDVSAVEAGSEQAPDAVVVGETSSTASGLPKVSDLGSDPPAPGDPFTPGADTRLSTAPGDVDASAADGTEVTAPSRPPASRGVRGLAEAGGGVAGATLFGFGGLIVGGLAGFILDGGQIWFGTLILGSMGALIGMAVGLPAGVVFVGKKLDGNGKWWAVLLGEAAGFTLGFGLANACFGCTAGVLTVIVLPVVGAVLGYELTSDASASAARGLRALRPTLVPTSDGKPVVGVGFRF